MIYTNEPANVFYVLVSAFRSNLCDEVNMSRHRHMVNSLRNAPLEYGSVESTDLTGCYREAIASAPTEELTVRVRCSNKAQAIAVARLACNEFEQDCVLIYKSQTHSAALIFAGGLDGWKTERIGTFQMVAPEVELTGNYTVDEFGRGWMVEA